MVIKVTSETKLYAPVQYKVRDIANKMAILDREVKYLVNKAKIWRPKIDPIKNQTNTTEETEKSESNDNESTKNETTDKNKETIELEKEDNETTKAEETLELPGTSDEGETKKNSESNDEHTEL